MLALESAAARSDGPPVLIFDEIDAGVGGTLGAVLGKKLAELAEGRQVLCITHLATIAARADGHWSVSKEVKNDRTRTRVRGLTDEERVVEIARLFGTAGDTADVGLRHARELLGASRRS
jgi:DNA repair protein RecN (Recombination protein N)